jgi:hypothetical protein
METIAKEGLNLPMLLAYGSVILVYLIVLRLLLSLLQQMGDKHRTQRSVIDADIHRTMGPQIEASMQTFDVYRVAIIIAKGGITALSMAIIIFLLTVKAGIVATGLLITGVVLCLWAADHWLKSQEKAKSIRGEVRKYVQKSGSMGMIIMLSITLVVLLFVLVWMH